MKDYSNVLIFGKNPTERIVSVHQSDGYADLYIQSADDSISVQQISSKYWLLADSPSGSGWIRLKGNQYYKFGYQCNTREEINALRGSLKRRNKDYYSIYNPIESCLVNRGITYYKGLEPKDVSILSFDLETTGLVHDKTSKVLLISTTFRIKDKITRKLFAYDDYKTPKEMIDAFCAYVREMDPSIICGHNIYGFDFQYLKYIADQNDTSLKLGRDGSDAMFNPYESKFRFDGSRDLHYHGLRIVGREICDTMFLAVKADIGRKYQSYGLKPIIKAEGLQKEDRVLYDASQIRFNYHIPEEWQKIKEYCVHDSDDALALFDLYVPPFFYINQSIPKSFQGLIESATGSQINSLMIRSYLQEGFSLPKASENYHFEGAISFGNPGVYSNCLKVDVASLYPSIMIQYSVGNKEKDPNEHFQKLVNHFTQERLKNKKLAKDTQENYYKHLEQSQKIIINSFYGFLGAPGLLFNSPKDAEFITKKGREVLKTAIEWATGNNYGETKI